MKKKAKSKAGSGGTFEQAIAATCADYERQGIATLEKVDPPTRAFNMGGHVRVKFLENPFLDFTGAWTERGGRALHVECKSIKARRLPIGCEKSQAGNKTAGISAEQMASAARWEAAGAVVCYLWQRGGSVRMLTPALVRATLATGSKSVPWFRAYRVPQGEGFALIDFLALLRALHPTTNTTQK